MTASAPRPSARAASAPTAHLRQGRQRPRPARRAAAGGRGPDPGTLPRCPTSSSKASTPTCRSAALAGRDWAREKYAAFAALLARLAARGIKPAVTQVWASSGLLAGMPDICNAVCVGHLLYGLSPVATDVARSERAAAGAERHQDPPDPCRPSCRRRRHRHRRAATAARTPASPAWCRSASATACAAPRPARPCSAPGPRPARAGDRRIAGAHDLDLTDIDSPEGRRRGHRRRRERRPVNSFKDLAGGFGCGELEAVMTFSQTAWQRATAPSGSYRPCARSRGRGRCLSSPCGKKATVSGLISITSPDSWV